MHQLLDTTTHPRDDGTAAVACSRSVQTDRACDHVWRLDAAVLVDHAGYHVGCPACAWIDRLPALPAA